VAVVEQFSQDGGVTTQDSGVQVVGAAAREIDEDITVDELGESGSLGGHCCVLTMMMMWCLCKADDQNLSWEG